MAIPSIPAEATRHGTLQWMLSRCQEGNRGEQMRLALAAVRPNGNEQIRADRLRVEYPNWERGASPGFPGVWEVGPTATPTYDSVRGPTHPGGSGTPDITWDLRGPSSRIPTLLTTQRSSMAYQGPSRKRLTDTIHSATRMTGIAMASDTAPLATHSSGRFTASLSSVHRPESHGLGPATDALRPSAGRQ